MLNLPPEWLLLAIFCRYDLPFVRFCCWQCERDDLWNQKCNWARWDACLPSRCSGHIPVLPQSKPVTMGCVITGRVAQAAPREGGRGGRVRPAVQRPTVSEVASEPKPEPYPWVNPPHRTTQEQAPPSFLNSCHMLGGKQLTGSWSVKGGGGRGLKVWGEKMLITAFLVRYCWFRHAPAVAFVASCYWFNERGEIWRQQVSN